MDHAQTKEVSPAATTDTHSQTHDHTDRDDYTRARKTKFRFKSSSSKSRSSRNDTDTHRHRHRKRTHHDRSHRSKRHKHTTTTPPPDDNDNPRGLSPNTAFRESLFDALGDDEGAAYWESVYGQPIHNYAVPDLPKGPNGELESMTEDEYAAYVRTRMWERTREGMVEMQEQLQRERREKAKRERERERDVEGERERRAFERAMEESLARGRERKKGRVWRGVGEEYLQSWKRVDSLREGKHEITGGGKDLGELVFWPVESGKRRDVSREAVEEFMKFALVPASAASTEKDGDALISMLKAERVRWHPDKIQHRYGALGIDEDIMRSVTEVFQIIDHMWNELKERA